ncbi:MAG TPA: helix-turn-helix transcriptional regulator [Anaeromyxobacteraceae bacterium]|jgi:AraC-like DNA-binding protein|nr:helix-turn-helix transcriptional regulator [Anaeromyxobacteraceae bacterium]
MPRHIRTPFDETLPHPVYFRTDSLQPDSSYPRHRHHWGELVYAFSGVMELKLADHHYLAPPQYGIWLPPEVEHVGLNRHEATFCSLYLAPARCRRLPREACALAVGPLLRALLERLRARGIDTPRSAPDSRLVEVLVDELAAAPRQGTYLPTSEDPLLRPVLAALQARPDDPRSLAEWAGQVHATERTLARRCQRDLGMSFGEWRQRLRIVRAMALLDAGRSVESIALDLGYGSSSAFIAMFHRMTGTSPHKLRREAGTGSGARP